MKDDRGIILGGDLVWYRSKHTRNLIQPQKGSGPDIQATH